MKRDEKLVGNEFFNAVDQDPLVPYRDIADVVGLGGGRRGADC